MKNGLQILLLPAFALPMIAVACGAGGPSEIGANAGSGGRVLAQAGSAVQAGATAQGGSSAASGAGAGASAGGLAGAGGISGATGGAGSSGAGGRAAGGTPGVAGGVGQGGIGAGGSGGTGDSSELAKALDGLRVDDPCAGTPDTANGAVCNHVVLTAGGFKSAKEASIAGMSGVTYDVTLRIRGIVEPTQIDGGMRLDTTTFQYQNMTWRKVPFTIGGTVNRGDYSQWRIAVSSPKQEYFLNDYQTVGHYIFALDYQVTIQMAANSKLTLDATDSNERQIVNYEKYAVEGIPGSMNYGQFIQCNVVSVKPH